VGKSLTKQPLGWQKMKNKYNSKISDSHVVINIGWLKSLRVVCCWTLCY